MQVCVSFNRSMGYEWYRDNTYQLTDTGHDSNDRMAAIERALEYPGGEGKIPLGIFYQNNDTPSYEEQVPVLEAGPLADQPLRKYPIEKYRELLDELF